MKSIVTVLLFAFAISSFSQTIVGTSPQNRNVLLEEFTGINCSYCPDGHRIAGEIMENSPSQVHIVAIHTGQYSTPATGQPDYTTSFGAAIASQAALGGFPSGTVNRHFFSAYSSISGTAMGRQYWTEATDSILSMSSCVNMAMDIDVDFSTREVTLLVEIYYTANSASSVNYLNIALLQNYLVGPQAGAIYNPEYYPSYGSYYHMHMLRDLMTGQWGIPINNTTAGSFWDSTFVFTVPSAYLGIPFDLFNAEAVAFITETHQEVLTSCGVNFATDNAALIDISGVDEYICDSVLQPVVSIVNFGSEPLVSADIVYFVEGESQHVFSWTGSVEPNHEFDITLPQISTSISGEGSLVIWVENPNGNTDMIPVNDSGSVNFIYYHSEGETSFFSDFSSTVFPPEGAFLSEVNHDGKNWIRSDEHNGSAFLSWYVIGGGSIDDFNLEPLDFTGKSDVALTFNMAHRQLRYNFFDKLQVDVSTDCGETWTNVWMKSDPDLATGDSLSSAFLTPLMSEWRHEIVDLSAYDGMSEVYIRFRGTSCMGNNIFIDEINVDAGAAISEGASDNYVCLFPNPAQNSTIFYIDSDSPSSVDIRVYNSSGSEVYFVETCLYSGPNEINLNTSGLANGIYMIHIQNGAQQTSLRLIISR